MPGPGGDDLAWPALRRTVEERRGLELMRDAGVRRVAFLAKGLSPESRGLLDVLRKAGGLPPVGVDAGMAGPGRVSGRPGGAASGR